MSQSPVSSCLVNMWHSMNAEDSHFFSSLHSPESLGLASDFRNFTLAVKFHGPHGFGTKSSS